MRFQNESNKVVIELRVEQFWSEIILVTSNRTRAGRSFDFEFTSMISDQIALHSVQLPLLNTPLQIFAFSFKTVGPFIRGKIRRVFHKTRLK